MTLADYVITDGTRYIFKNHNDRYVPISNVTLADIFTKKQAEGIFNNSLPKALRKIFYIQKIVDNSNSNIETLVSVKENETTETLDCTKKWLDKVSSLNGLVTEIATRKEELLFELSNFDKELSDIEHYIEFSTLNAAQGYNAYKMIKERRIKRREIKKELDVLNIILNSKIGDEALCVINQRVAGLNNRKYTPRVLTELFNS